ncbi:MAG TPA: hypothetical protein VFS20_22075 [Longimicrobium sp.]|nr:hypothetical protein [Longimicrobium sp.]
MNISLLVIGILSAVMTMVTSVFVLMRKERIGYGSQVEWARGSKLVVVLEVLVVAVGAVSALLLLVRTF